MTKKITMLDLFSGIGGFSKGFEQAGYEVNHLFSEIDKHAIAIYKQNFKNSKYVGSVTDVRGKELPKINVITFGSPCQDFSLAGKRSGMEGQRSSLITEAIRLIHECRPDFFIWENVKGVYSSNEGRDFQAILREFANIGGYRLEWQLLNTKWFLPQNRERIYLVGHLATPKRSFKQVFPIGEDGEIFREERRRGAIRPRHSRSITCSIRKMRAEDTYINVISATKKGYETAQQGDSINFSVPTSKTRRGRVGKGVAQTLDTASNQGVVVPLREVRTEDAKKERKKSGTNSFRGKEIEIREDGVVGAILGSPTIDNSVLTHGTITGAIGRQWSSSEYIDSLKKVSKATGLIRRLTPIECERLQGFEDNWTKYGNYDGEVREVADTNRYKCCGNAVTVNVVQAIAERINL